MDSSEMDLDDSFYHQQVLAVNEVAPIASRLTPQQPNTPSPLPPAFPTSVAGKRKRDDDSNDWNDRYKIDMIEKYGPGIRFASPSHPYGKVGRKVSYGIRASKAILSSFYGWFTGSNRQQTFAVITGEDCAKRRAIQSDVSPSKLTARIPGAFPSTPKPRRKVRFAPSPQCEQLPTPPTSHDTTKDEEAERYDSPMAEVHPALSPEPVPAQAQPSPVKEAASASLSLGSATAALAPSAHSPPAEQQKADAPSAAKAAPSPLLLRPVRPRRAEGAPIIVSAQLTPVRNLHNPRREAPSPPSVDYDRCTNWRTSEETQLLVEARKDKDIAAKIDHARSVIMGRAYYMINQSRIRRFKESADYTGPSCRAQSDYAWDYSRNIEYELKIAKKELEVAKQAIAERDARAEKEAKAAELKKAQSAIEKELRDETAKQAAALEQQLQEAAAKQAEAAEEKKRQDKLAKDLEQKARLSDPTSTPIIHALDAEWQAKVNNEMAVKSRNHVIAKTTDGTELTRKDFGTLLPQEGTEDRPNGWLNDEIVNGFLSNMAARKAEKSGYVRSSKSVPPYVAFSSAWYSNYQKRGGITNISRWARRKGVEGAKILKCEKIFFPINTGAHWSLLIISPLERTMEVLDSLHGSSKKWFTIGRAFLEMELGKGYVASEWTELPSSSAWQNNSNDCGVFTCFNALASAKGIAFAELANGEMTDARRLLAATFLNGGFHGAFDL